MSTVTLERLSLIPREVIRQFLEQDEELRAAQEEAKAQRAATWALLRHTLDDIKGSEISLTETVEELVGLLVELLPGEAHELTGYLTTPRVRL